MGEKRQPKSPYQRYNKSPYLYSPIYQLWREAALDSGASSEKAIALSCKHAKFVGVRRYTPEGDFSAECEVING